MARTNAEMKTIGLETRFKKGDSRASKAGIKSGEVRRCRMSMEECAKYVGEMLATGSDKQYLIAKGVPDDMQTNNMAILLKTKEEAMEGNIRAVEQLYKMQSGNQVNVNVNGNLKLEYNGMDAEQLSKEIDRLDNLNE